MSSLGLWGGGRGLWGGDTNLATYPAYHFVLGGQGFMMPPGGWSRKLGTQYALKMSVNGTTQNDRLGNQSLTINDWSGGEGQLRHESGTDRYRKGSGIDPFTEAGAVGLGSYMAAVAAVTSLALAEITCLHVYKGLLMIGFSNGKVYQFDGTTLTFNYDTTKAGGIRSMMTWEGTLYVGTGTDGIVYRWTGVTPTTVWAANFTVGPRGGDTVTGVYGLSPQMSGGAFLGYYASSGLSYALAGQIANTAGTTDPGHVSSVNMPDGKIGMMTSFREKLVVAAYNTTDRYWTLYEGNDANPTVWTRKSLKLGGYAASAAVLNDKLYLGDAYQGRVWIYDGSTVRLLRQLGSDQQVYGAAIRGMVAWRGGMWASIRDLDSTPAMMRYDDAADSWSRPITGLAAASDAGVAAVYNDELYVATVVSGVARLYRTNSTFAATGYVETGLINANLTGTEKLWTGVQVNHSKLVASQSVQVLYQVEDDGTWVSLGTNSTVGTTTATFDFPSAITAEQIAFKIVLAGPAGGASPLKVFALVPSYLPSPGAGREWSIRVLLHGTAQKHMSLADGTVEPLTGEELSAEMWAMVDAVRPVTLVDIDRTEYTVQILEYSEALAASKGQFSADALGWEMDGTLRLREVGA